MLEISVKINNSQYNAVMKRLNNLMPNLKQQLSLDTAATAMDLETTAKAYAHVITGRMRDSIATRKTGETSHKVFVGVDYGVYENARGSPHDFFDQAVADASPDFQRRVETSVKDVVNRK